MIVHSQMVIASLSIVIWMYIFQQIKHQFTCLTTRNQYNIYKKSSDKETFDAYQTLWKSGSTHKPAYNEGRTTSSTRRTRTRKIIWFNPPFDLKVKTKVGKDFIRIIQECFPKGHALHQIFTSNTVKLSYSCMPTMDSVINSHNHNKVVGPEVRTEGCNCRDKKKCPLYEKGGCLQKGIVYQSTVTNSGTSERDTYFSQTATSFKEEHKTYKSSTQLSKRAREYEI